MAEPQSLRQLNRNKQQLMDRLLEENQNGSLSSHDAAALCALVEEAERLMVENAKALETLTQCEQPNRPVGAVPVTVWIKPSIAAN